MKKLEKYVSDLSEEDKRSIAIKLGISGRPYPMRDTAFVENERGEKILVQHLGVLEDDENPLIVYSDRRYHEVVGMAMREMPTPGMLPLFFDAISRRRPESKRTIQYLKGAAGSGKTYMGELISRMRCEKGAIKIDCGKKNLAELLYETVLDFGKDRRFYDELDSRLASNSLNPVSIALLREGLGEAFHEDEAGKVSIDWHMIGKNLHDENDDLEGSETAVKQALDALRSISHLEGLNKLGGNALGMATQEGPLIVAWKEGRDIILDEFNRAKQGTTASLHTVLQFFAGEIDAVTVENTLKEKGDDVGQAFTFRREDQKAGFSVTMTGNAEEDGHDVDELPQSVNSRIIPQFIPVATEEDWQHRICQILTGLPVSTIYNSAEEQWKADPEAFRAKLQEWRTMGLSDDEIKNVPDLHISLLERWESVLEASEMLARFYYGWSHLVNPESPLYRRASNLAELMEEIDERYNAEVSIDFRKIMDHFKEAMEARPSVIPLSESEGYDTGEWTAAPDASDFTGYDDPSVLFGTNLTRVIVNHINKTTKDINKNALHKKLERHAADCGVGEAQLLEGKNSTRKNIAKLLDDNPYESDVADVRVAYLRDLLCDYLRQNHTGIQDDNDKVLTVPMVAQALDGLKGSGFVAFNNNIDTPLHKVGIVDSLLQEEGNNTPLAQGLLSRDAFLRTLAAPDLRNRNLKAVWNEAISASGAVAKGQGDTIDESVAMAENTSKTGLAVTTIVVSHGEGEGKTKPVPLHIVWNSKADKLLVVGDGAIDPDLKRAFNMSNAVYIDRAEQGAVKKIETALKRVVSGKNSRDGNFLKAAFLMRNTLGSLEKEEKVSLQELMVNKEIKSLWPHYITNRPARPEAA